MTHTNTQIGPDSPRDDALLDFFVQAASRRAFYELRTRQRLGYSVSLHDATCNRCASQLVATRILFRSSPGIFHAAQHRCHRDTKHTRFAHPTPNRVLALGLRVQSPETQPAALAAAVGGWLAGFRGELEGLEQEEVGNHKKVRCNSSCCVISPAKLLA